MSKPKSKAPRQRLLGEMVRLKRNFVSVVYETVEDEPGGDIEIREDRKALIKAGTVGLAVSPSRDSASARRLIDVLLPSGQIWPVARHSLEPV
jgi:hypothetical protein